MKYAVTAALAAILLAACDPGGMETAPPRGAGPDAGGMATAATDRERDMSPAAIHERVFTLDTHVDIDAGYATHELDPGGFTPAQVDLPKMRAGGLDAAFFIVYVGQGTVSPVGYEEAAAIAEDKYDAIRRMIAGYPERIGLATTAGEVEAIRDSGRLVALIGMENSWPIGEDISNVALWAERGVRYMSITHFGNNQFGGSSNPNLAAGDSPVDPGLTDLGRALVAALNDHAIMVDVSHVGKTTMLDAIALSRAPVIASHSGARAVYDHPRNLDDEQLRAIAENGGVAQMVAFRGYVDAPDPDYLAAQQELAESLGVATREARAAADEATLQAYREGLAALRARYPDVTVADFVDHIDHAVSVAGIDHVGIASDFDGGGGVLGWDDATQTPEVTAELLRRGYSEEDIAKIWSGNVLRVMRAVEAAKAN